MRKLAAPMEINDLYLEGVWLSRDMKGLRFYPTLQDHKLVCTVSRMLAEDTKTLSQRQRTLLSTAQ